MTKKKKKRKLGEVFGLQIHLQKGYLFTYAVEIKSEGHQTII